MAKRRTKIAENVEHGKASTYNNHGCGCEFCTEAWALYMGPRIKDYRERKKRERLEATCEA